MTNYVTPKSEPKLPTVTPKPEPKYATVVFPPRRWSMKESMAFEKCIEANQADIRRIFTKFALRGEHHA